MELVQDGQANLLIYGANDCVNASKMFKPLVDYLYALKNDDVKLAKDMLNTLWGALCQRNHRYKKAYLKGDVTNLPEGCEITNISPGDDNHFIRYAEYGKYYVYAYARLGPFLTSAVRKFMSDTMQPHRDHIYRIHTDGFITDKVIDLPLSRDLGKWKIEHKGNCIISNACKVEWI